MVIRCERCSTLYELDEGLLAIGGSQVQCTRCQHVFAAYPPRAAGRTLVGVPPAAESAAPQKQEAPARATPRPRNDLRSAPRAVASVPAEAHALADPAPAEATRAPAEAPTSFRASTPAALSQPALSQPAEPAPAPAATPPAPPPERPRVVRTGPPPVYRPSTSTSPPTGGRAPLLRRDTVGTFENRLRWSARWRWLAPAIAIGAVAVVVALWLTLGRSAPDSARGSDAASLLAQDDAASVEQAISRLDAVLRRAPKNRTAESERALAYVLRAAAVSEEGEGFAARLAARSADRERLGREQAAGWEDAARAAASDVQKLEAEVRTREERARSLGTAASAALRRQQAEHGDGPEVARALAAYHALVGERDRARKVSRGARDKAPADPWLDLAEGWADARDPERAARERALVELGSLSVAHPELLRGRYLLARTEASLGRAGEALRTLDALLAANPRHESARRLRDELASAPVPLPASPPPAPAAAATQDAAAQKPPEAPLTAKPASQRRKVVTHTVPEPVPSVTVLPPLMEGAEPQGRLPPRGAGAPEVTPDAPAEGAATPGAPPPSASPAPAGTRTRETPRPSPDSRREAEPAQSADGG